MNQFAKTSLAEILAYVDHFRVSFFPNWRLTTRQRFKEAMRQACALDQVGLTQEAISLYQHAIILYPSRPEPYIELAMAKIKLRRFDEASQVIDFARNHVRSKVQRFGLLLIETHIAYERFQQQKDPHHAYLCHHLVNCMLDLRPDHPFPLHIRVILHLDLALDTGSNEVRKVLELEKAMAAMQHYLCLATRFPPALRKYHNRFVPELKAYISSMPAESQDAWNQVVNQLRFIGMQNSHASSFKSKSIQIMRKYTFGLFGAIASIGYLALTVWVDGIFVIDCADIF
jgi:tetratricopeptide (TPR) repeat protein